MRCFFARLFFGLTGIYFSMLLSAEPTFEQPRVAVVNAETVISLLPYLEYAIDESSEVNVEQLHRNPVLLDFKPVSSQSMPAIYTPVWYRFSVINSHVDKLSLVINFDEMLFDDLRFSYLSGESWQHAVGGLNHAFSERTVPYRFLAFPLTLDAQSTTTVYFRALASHIPLVAPTLSNANQFSAATMASSVINLTLIGIGIGLCLAMLIFMPVTTNKREAYAFIAYVLATTLVIISVSGFLQYLFPYHPEWHKFFMVALLALNCISNLFMVNTFFEVFRWNPLMNTFYRLAYIFYALFILAYAFVGGYETLMLPLIIATFMMFVLLFTTSLYKYFQGFAHAGLFLLAIIVFFVSCTYTALGAEGLLPYNSIIRHSVGSGIILQVIIICIAAAKKANEERLHAQTMERNVMIANAAAKEKSEFLATMSHEIRTPVNGVLGMAQMLEQTPLSDEQSHYTGVIMSSGKTLLAVINDILDFSKIEAGKMELEETPFDLQELVTYTLSLFAPQAEKKRLNFSIDLASDCPTALLGDSIRLQQVINNLLSNAFKFTDTGYIGIEIRSHQQDDNQVTLLFSVTDSGIGIARNKQAHIFSAFTQADKSTTRTYGGTGLGLAISQQLVKLMGGEIGLISDAGNGAEFWFTVRCNVQSASGCTSVEKLPTISANSPILSNCKSQGTVLIAEDNPVNQQVIAAIFLKANIPHTIKADGLLALEAFEQAPSGFAGILMDLEMPNKDGYATAMAIRAIEADLGLQRMPIIALTAHVLEENLQRCYASGMDGVLKKPLQIDELLQTLQRFEIIA